MSRDAAGRGADHVAQRVTSEEDSSISEEVATIDSAAQQFRIAPGSVSSKVTHRIG